MSRMQEMLEVGEELFIQGYFDEAEFFLNKILQSDATREIHKAAAGMMYEICRSVHRTDDAERFEQLYRELGESRRWGSEKARNVLYN